jgi:hypothetical protein
LFLYPGLFKLSYFPANKRQGNSALKTAIVFLLHALSGWALCGAVMGIGMRLMPLQNALLLHLLAAPVIFAMVTLSFHKRVTSARPVFVAAGFTVFVMAMDFFVIAMAILKSFEMFDSFLGTWLPFAMIFVSSWMTGRSMRKSPRAAKS